MKLKYTYIFFLAISGYIFLKSDASGRTSSGTPLQTCNSAGCHTPAAAGTTLIDSLVVIEKSTGARVTQYKAGSAYTLRLHGRYAGFQNLYKFGFVVGNGGKGTLLGNRTTNTAINTVSGTMYWGHTTPLDSFRRQGTNTIFIDTASWIAPAAGSGTVTFSSIINAVNVNGSTTGDCSNFTPNTKVLTEYLANVNVTIGGGSTFCAGTSKTFTANPINGGTTPTYQWYLNGATVGTGGTTYTNASLANNDSVWVVMTSSISGIGNSPATSNKIKVTVNSPFANSVSITCDKTTVCAGDSATFTATASAGSTGVSYRWYINQTLTNITTVNTWTRTGFNAGDSISCRTTVTNPCSSPTVDTSNYIKLTVSASPVISNNVSQVICAGDSSALTAWASTMTGTTFTWTNSNTAIGLPASGTGQIDKFLATNTGTGLINAVITVKGFAGGCSGAPVTFNITVRPVPRVRRPTTVAPFYCSGANVPNITLQTIPNFGPTVKWYNSNKTLGLTADSGSTATIAGFTSTNTSNDSVYTTITARATQSGCVGPDSTFNIVINPRPIINTVPNITACQNSNVDSIVLSSNSPIATFTWTNNNTAIGLGASGSGNIPQFTSGNSLASGTITTTAFYKSCAGTPKTFIIKVDTPNTPAVLITTKDSSGCPGYSSKFTALPTNGGITPTYQWYINGSPITGATADTFLISSVMNNQAITCVMTSSSKCVTSSSANSNTVNLKVFSTAAPTITLTTLKDTICDGDAITINTSLTNGGSSPVFQWYKNGDTIVGATGSSFITSSLKMNDKITCDVISSLTCANPKTSISNELKFKVFTVVPTQISMTKDKNSICSDEIVTFTVTFKGGGSNPKVQWTLNGTDMSINPSFMQIPITTNTDVITVNVTSSEVCPNPKVMSVSTSIDTVKQGPFVDVFPNTYIAFCEGDSVEVKAFNGQPNYSYLWSNGITSDKFWSKNTNSFTLKVTEPGNACPRYLGPITTHMNLKPSKPSIASSDGLLRSTFADRYQWQLNRIDIFGADSQYYKIPIKGSYRVKVTNLAGCVNYSDDLIAYPLSISNGNIEESIKIYPNPTTEVINISSLDKKIYEVIIYDLMGKIVYEDNHADYNKSISLTSKPKGNYLLQIKTDTDSYQQKIELK